MDLSTKNQSFCVNLSLLKQGQSLMTHSKKKKIPYQKKWEDALLLMKIKLGLSESH